MSRPPTSQAPRSRPAVPSGATTPTNPVRPAGTARPGVPEDYLAKVAQVLGSHAPAHADDLAELACLLAEADDAARLLADLGPAQDYAAALLADAAQGADADPGEDGEPRRVLGAPVGLDLANLPARVARTFDPEGPLLVPRSLGIGWDLNLGALAVRLHLVAPDDLGEDLEPGPVLTAATAGLPVALAAATHLAATRLPVPTGVRTAARVPGRTASPGATLAPLLAAVGLAARDTARRATFPERLGHAVAACALTGVGAAAVWDSALVGEGAPRRARLAPAALVAGTVLAAAGAGALAVRLAVRRTMRRTSRP